MPLSRIFSCLPYWFFWLIRFVSTYFLTFGKLMYCLPSWCFWLKRFGVPSNFVLSLVIDFFPWFISSWSFPFPFPHLTLSLLLLDQICETKRDKNTMWVRKFLPCYFPFLSPVLPENDFCSFNLQTVLVKRQKRLFCQFPLLSHYLIECQVPCFGCCFIIRTIQCLRCIMWPKNLWG